MGNLSNKVELDRIRKKLKKLAWMGKAGYLEYDSYINDYLKNNKVDYLYQCLDAFYDIKASDYPKFDTFKIAAWNRILEVSTSPFQETLAGMYRRRGVYQIGNEIHNDITGTYTIELSETLDEGLSILATQSKIGLMHQNGKMVLDIVDTNISKVEISQVAWATYSVQPIVTETLQSITAEPYHDTLTYTGTISNPLISDFSSTVNQVYVTASINGVDRIDLSVGITHSFLGDLQINLSAPNGRTINVKRQGGRTDGGKSMNVTFTTDNSYDRLVRTYKNDITGTYRMDKFGGIGTGSYVSNATEAKQLTDGQVVGTWSLVINDVGTGNTGSVVGWSLDIKCSRQNEHLQLAQYETKISTLRGGTYLIKVETRSPYGRFLYRADIKKYDLLGTVTEIDATELVDSVYYVRSRKVSQVNGTARIFLEVAKTSTGEVRTFMSDDPEISEETNLFDRYEQAINFLLS